jgi:hypothetical protein
MHTTLKPKAQSLSDYAAELIRHDPKAMNSRQANAASEITDSSLLAITINHFKHYY